jgi:hypothetical protein
VIGNGTFAGSYLGDVLARSHVDRCEDIGNDAFVAQEMLAETLARDVLHRRYSLPAPDCPHDLTCRPR